MNIIIILAIVGIILAVVLTLVVYFLWRYVEKSKEFFKHKAKPSKGSLVDIKQFEIPLSYRTVKAQQPFIQSDFYIGNELPVNSTKRFSNSLIPDYLTKRVSVSDGYESCDATSVNSMPIEPGKRESQELISNDLMNYLKLLSKDSMRRSSQDSNYSLTDQSGGSQNEELFESTTVGESKKRIARFHRKRNSNSKQIYKLAGHLTFRSDYSQEYNVLTIHILRLMDLASEKPVNEVNPFVRAYLLPGKMHKQNSKYQIGKKNPFIDERMVFPDILKEDMNKYKLKLKVYNHSRLLRSELLGEVDIALSSLDLNASETFTVDLFVKAKKKGSRPLLMVSLNNQATSSKLEVIIHKAKNLPKSTNHIFAVVSLIKYDYFERKDTATKLYSSHADFNESLEFDLYTNVDSPLQSYTLVISLVNSKAVGGDQIIGHVIFSECFPHSATASHWKSVENSPHKRITEWHSLIDPEIS